MNQVDTAPLEPMSVVMPAPTPSPSVFGGPFQATRADVKPWVDLRVPTQYVNGDARIEVLGVCKISEDEGVCWNSKGVIDQALTKTIVARFSKGGDRESYPLQIFSGKKNRIILVRTGSGVSKFEPKLALITESARILAMHEQVSPENMPVPLRKHPDLFFVASDRTDKFTSLYSLVVEPVGQSPNIRLLEGTSIRFDELAIKVGKVKRLRDHWEFELDITGKVNPRRHFVVTALDAKGKSITNVNVSGEPVTKDYMDKSFREFRHTAETTSNLALAPPIFRTGRPNVRHDADSRWILSSNADPKYIESVYFAGSRAWAIEINGIPLDPIKTR